MPDDIILMADPRVAHMGVVDVGEPLVDVRSRGSSRIRLGAPRDGADAYAHVRAGVLDRLVRAAEALPDGLGLLLVEGFRPPALQRRYFDAYSGRLRDDNPAWSAHELRTAASRYIAPPEVAPHTAGAAIDVTLCDAHGRELDMGTPVNATPEDSEGACYAASARISDEARTNRDVLGSALSSAGFVNYPTEWWHWSYGDRYWALLTGAPAARYGATGLG